MACAAVVYGRFREFFSIPEFRTCFQEAREIRIPPTNTCAETRMTQKVFGNVRFTSEKSWRPTEINHETINSPYKARNVNTSILFIRHSIQASESISALELQHAPTSIMAGANSAWIFLVPWSAISTADPATIGRSRRTYSGCASHAHAWTNDFCFS